MSADHVSARLSTLAEHDRQGMARADAIVDAVAAIAATARGLWRTLARAAASRSWPGTGVPSVAEAPCGPFLLRRVRA